jgi:Fur family transcriptional regulator, zinc uptake regulator
LSLSIGKGLCGLEVQGTVCAMKKPTKRRPAPEQDQMIVEALRGAGRPVSAYEIIDSLRARASLAPQTVYRSLDRLIASGAAHRLESLNAFVACTHDAHEGTAIFAICTSCGTVRELDEPDAVASLANWARAERFAVRQMTLELRGTCADCGNRG